MFENGTIKSKLSNSFSLFIVSFLILFAEVMVIRWLGTEIPLIRTLPNLILICIFISTSAGLATHQSNYIKPVIVIAGSIILTVGLICSHWLPLRELHLHTGLSSLVCLFFIGALVLVLTLVFLNIGKRLGREFEKLAPAEAYNVNLLGSMFGVVVFGLVSWLTLSPAAWIAITTLAVFFLTRKRYVVVIGLVLSVFQMSTDCNSLWSPYGKINIVSEKHTVAEVPPGNLTVIPRDELLISKRPSLPGNFALYECGDYFNSGHDMKPVEHWSQIEKTYSDWRSSAIRYRHWMEIPSLASSAHDKILVLGSGPGNDVQCFLNHNPSLVDAVDRDPIIVKSGEYLHPQLPYKDKRVSVFVEDARTFLRRTNKKYDIVQFAYLDPGSTLKANSILRSDNFVYTLESIKSALSHIGPKGIVAISFASPASGPNSSVTRRLYSTITSAYGQKPYAIASEPLHSIFFLFGPGVVKLPDEFMKHEGLREWPLPGEYIDTIPASDDWPFLYLDHSNTLALIIYLIAITSSAVVPLCFLRGVRFNLTRETLPAFFLGMAFMLVETKSITKLSLLFGATWLVSSVVIFIIIALAYIANLIVMKYQPKQVWPLYVGLGLTLILDYFFVLPESSNINAIFLSCLTSVINCLPVFFGGLIFSRLLADSKNATALLSINLLGVAIGGILENLCLHTGIRNLSVVAFIIYMASCLPLFLKSKKST
jgi:hypothetical protein